MFNIRSIAGAFTNFGHINGFNHKYIDWNIKKRGKKKQFQDLLINFGLIVDLHVTSMPTATDKPIQLCNINDEIK